jgi:hypothetical protein
MPRCFAHAMTALVMCPVLLAPLSASAQYARVLPTNTLRGKVAFGQPPDATLNGQAIRLAPGTRIRGANNMPVLSGAVAGQTLIVNFTMESSGLLKDIWILTADEISRLWPRTPQELATWTYDGVTQSWIKP